MDREGTVAALNAALDVLRQLQDWTPDPLESVLRPLAVQLGIKTGQLFGALRVGVTGRMAAPPLFDTMSVLGRDRCIKRLNDALNALESTVGAKG